MTSPILFLGEAQGSHEARLGRPFVGPSGAALLSMCEEAGVFCPTAADRDYLRDFYRLGDPRSIDAIWQLHPELARANVFDLHPPANDITALCGPKSAGLKGWPALAKSQYLLPEYEHELARLDAEINRHNPNLLVCLGNTPLWATCGITAISRHRGTTRLADRVGNGRKILPCYHPAAVLRDYSLRPLTILDLTKAAREQSFPEIRRPVRRVFIEPSLSDLEAFYSAHIAGCRLLSVDIETSGTRVTCIGMAPGAELALVIPFDDSRATGAHYWKSLDDERRAWRFVRRVLVDPVIPKLFQNGLYDIGFLWRSYGIGVRGAVDDTMLCHHALQPESQKGLGFLGSVYTDEGAWKTERKVETIKKDD